ncbi:MAG: heparinase II/III family protein [Clostridia bacterium]|nr:heparinase II/III family protein [Clostridia bacterium]
MKTIGRQILDAARKMHAPMHHPRIIMTEADFDRLRQNREVGAYKAMLDTVFKKANEILEKPVSEYVIPDGVRLLVTSRRVEEFLAFLSFAYRISGEKKYLDRAILEIEAACAFPDFHPRHFLDCAELCIAFAFAYDWLYADLPEALRATMRDRLIKNGFNAVMEEYNNESEHKNVIDTKRGYRWYQDKPGDNWKMVCNGSLSLAVLAIFDEVEYEHLETILTSAFDDTYEAVRTFYDAVDGTYSEGVNYWSYATRFLAFYSAGLFTAAGSDFGLTDYVGVARSPYFLLSLSSPDRVGFNFGDAVASRITNPIFSWCAARYNDPGLYAVRREDIMAGRTAFVDVLFYREVPPVPLSALPLGFGRVGADNATFRTDASENALFAGIHFAKNNAYHGHHDMGTFILNVGDKRFFVDLGSDNYNLKPYRGCYRFRAEGHNTVIFNPAPENDQIWEAACTTNRFVNTADYGFAVADMSAAYPGREVVRGLMLDRREETVLLQDEIRCEREDLIRWSAHTPARITLSEDAKTAILDIDGTRLCAELLTEGAFEVCPGRADESSPIVQPAPRESSPIPEPQRDNEGISRLTLYLSGKPSHRICIRFYPLGDGGISGKEAAKTSPLVLWS